MPMKNINKNNELLKLSQITMDFPGTRALDNVDFNLYQNEIHAIVRDNGAGKSTLPCGFNSTNLPVGLQIIAPKEKEVELLQASWAFENISSWHEKRPIF